MSSPPTSPSTAAAGAAAAADSPVLGSTGTGTGTRSATPAAMPDEDAGAEPEMPLTMAASVVLTSLPRDATTALLGAGEVGVDKVRFRPVGSAPALRQAVAKVSTSQRFETVVRFLRKKLRLKDHESVFCYVNSVFAPGLDENVGNLWRCFKVGDELVVSYSITQAYG